MAWIADTGAIVALYDRDDLAHPAIRALVERPDRPAIVLPLPVLAEIDYLLTKYLGDEAAFDFLHSIGDGAFLVDHLDEADLARATALAERYRDLGLGFVDAAVIIVAERLRATTILTLDLRDFRAVGAHAHGPLRLLPADG